MPTDTAADAGAAARPLRSATRTPHPAVHISGIGAVTGYGWGVPALFDGLASGESAVTLHEGLDGFVAGGKAYLSLIDTDKAPEGGSTIQSRYTQATRFAADEAIADATARGWIRGDTVGVITCAVLGDAESWRDHYQSEGATVSGRTWVRLMPSTVVTMLMKEHDFHGPAMQVGAMCVSSISGMLQAKLWLDAGICTDVLVLATDLSGLPENLRHFSDINAASLDQPPLQASRPLQEGSAGFVGGEAAVAMLLTTDAHGAYADLLGGAQTSDGVSAVSIASDYVELYRCVTEALADAGVDGADVQYLNAHGPGTDQCSAAEAGLLDTFLPHAKAFAVKPFVGHCQAAASAVETLATIYAFQTGILPSPPHVAKAHARLVDGSTPAEPGLTLKAALGFGGNNGMVVLAPPAP